MHLYSVISANDTRESALGHRNFPHREGREHLAPEASGLTTENNVGRSKPEAVITPPVNTPEVVNTGGLKI